MESLTEGGAVGAAAIKVSALTSSAGWICPHAGCCARRKASGRLAHQEVFALLLQVVEELVLICKRVHRAKLRTIPPLPNWVKELTALNEVRGVGTDNGSLGPNAEAQLWKHAGLLSLPLAAPAPS